MATAVPQPSLAPAPSVTGLGRMASLDQFRGYTVAGMFLVNFLGNSSPARIF
ncbi:MAG: hypothetical protein U0903_13815 [Planctomycetales bacterium]